MTRYWISFRDYIFRVLLIGDCFLNVVLGGKLYETLSASAWLGEQQGKFFPCIFRPLIDFLFLPIERNHCANAYFSEFKRTQRP